MLSAQVSLSLQKDLSSESGERYFKIIESGEFNQASIINQACVIVQCLNKGPDTPSIPI